MNIALVIGSWSSNIGNAFYNLGAEWLLNDIGCKVNRFPESPRWKADVDSHYDPIARIKRDLVVLNGPCLNDRLPYVYRETFKGLYERGVKVAYLSAGMARYKEAEVDNLFRFFDEFPPYFVCTRDHQTAALLAKRASFPIYDGLCTSMFLNDAVSPAPLDEEPFVVLNFDVDHEPELAISEDHSAKVINQKVRKYPERLRELKIVRTSNLSMDRGYGEIYSRPNTYHSDLPRGYCSILKHAKIVYSQRVHTCATALIYGSKAQFIRLGGYSSDKRSQLFERIGVGEIFDRPVQLDFDFINAEKGKMKSFLRSLLPN